MKENPTLKNVIRESIFLALIRLMEKKPFSQISISELVETAGVGRSSFYRNFDSKAQVLSEYIHLLYNDWFKTKVISPVYSDSYNFLLPRFQFIKDNRKFFIVLRRNELLYYIFENLDLNVVLHLSGQKMFSRYHHAMFSGACAAVIRQWIDNDFRESPEELAQLFTFYTNQYVPVNPLDNAANIGRLNKE